MAVQMTDPLSVGMAFGSSVMGFDNCFIMVLDLSDR